MPFLYEKDDQMRRVTLTLVGEPNVAELLEVADRQAAEQAWDYQLLLDASARTGAAPSKTMVRAFADHTERLSSLFGPPGPFALVPHDNVGFGVARMFELLSTTRVPRRIRVFRSQADALEWLDHLQI